MFLLSRASTLIALIPALLQRMPEMFDEVGRALATVDEGYARFLDLGRAEAEAPAGIALRRLVWSAHLALQARADGRDVPVPAAGPAGPAGDVVPIGDRQIWEVFEELGREQSRRRLPLQTLLAAYQAGGRAAWRFISDVAVERGLSAEALSALADQVFCLIDDLVSVTTTGYVDEQERGHDGQERAQEDLVDALLSVPPDRGRVEQAARRAGWRLPPDAAVVLFRGDDPVESGRVGRLGPHLRLRHAAWPGVVLPDVSAPGRGSRLAAALEGMSAFVGPAVPPEQLAASARLAELAARTLPAPAPGGPPVFVEDQLAALILERDEELLGALRRRCLQPLDGLTPTSRETLQQTLRCWVRHMGNRTTMAAELGIHPQTVRYRLGRLRELFGASLDDPDFRLELVVALGSAGTGLSRPGTDPVAVRHATPVHPAPAVSGSIRHGGVDLSPGSVQPRTGRLRAGRS